MTLIEKFNKRFPNEDAFMRAVEAHMVEDDCRNISPRPSFCAGSLNMAMEMRMGAGALRGAGCEGEAVGAGWSGGTG